MDKIAPIHIFAPGPIAGAEKVVLEGLKSLLDQKIVVHCIIIQEIRAPKLANIFQELLNKYEISSELVITTKAFDLSLKKKIQISIQNHTATHLHTHGFKALFYTYLANNNLPHIHTHHGNTAHTLKVKLYEFIAHKLMKRCDAIVAVSTKMQEDLIKMGVDQGRIRYIANMLSIRPLDIPLRDIEKKINLLFIGRLSEEKGLADFLYALEEYKSLYNLTIVGSGTQETLLKELVATLNLKDCVTFTGFATDISFFLTQSDALILPSHREGLPMTLIEAVCSGLPILASNVGGIPLLVQDKKNGVLFKAKDTQEISNALKVFHQDYLSFKSTALVFKNDFIKLYSPKNWAVKTINLYKTL